MIWSPSISRPFFVDSQAAVGITVIGNANIAHDSEEPLL
jgi:hypothetical protein